MVTVIEIPISQELLDLIPTLRISATEEKFDIIIHVCFDNPLYNLSTYPKGDWSDTEIRIEVYKHGQSK